MKKFLLMVIALLCLPLAGWVDGVRADEVAWTGVATECELRTALLNNGASIQFTADIKLTDKLIINGKTITVDLCGHKLYRETDIWASNPDANVLNVANGSNLTLTSSESGDIDARTKGNEWDHTWE